MSDVLDQATPLQAHDAVPMDRLAPWLAATLGVDVSAVELGRFGRGFSNLTFLVRVGGRELVLRRPPPGVRIASAHDMTREARILQGVRRVWEKVPEVIAICEDPEVLGAPFFVMERIEGIILRDRAPRGLDLGPDVMRRLSKAMVDTLAAVHGLDLDAAGLADLGRTDGYVARQVEGWSRRYDDARTEELEDMAWLAAWLRDHQPAQSGAVLVHNDFKYDNVLLDPGDPARIVAVLDWEMATRGDPLLDLGTFLAYWVQEQDPPGMQLFRLCLTDLPGNLTRGELVERYRALTGRSFDPTWYFTFGLFKNAVVAQQLHARYVRGHTTEERYAHLNWAVRGIAAVARQAATEGRIEGLGV